MAKAVQLGGSKPATVKIGGSTGVKTPAPVKVTYTPTAPTKGYFDVGSVKAVPLSPTAQQVLNKITSVPQGPQSSAIIASVKAIPAPTAVIVQPLPAKVLAEAAKTAIPYTGITSPSSIPATPDLKLNPVSLSAPEQDNTASILALENKIKGMSGNTSTEQKQLDTLKAKQISVKSISLIETAPAKIQESITKTVITPTTKELVLENAPTVKAIPTYIEQPKGVTIGEPAKPVIVSGITTPNKQQTAAVGNVTMASYPTQDTQKLHIMSAVNVMPVRNARQFKIDAITEKYMGITDKNYIGVIVDLFPELYDQIVDGKLQPNDAVNIVKNLEKGVNPSSQAIKDAMGVVNLDIHSQEYQDKVTYTKNMMAKDAVLDAIAALPADKRDLETIKRYVADSMLATDQPTRDYLNNWAAKGDIAKDLSDRQLTKATNEQMITFFTDPAAVPAMMIGGAAIGAVGGFLATGTRAWVLAGESVAGIGAKYSLDAGAGALGSTVINTLTKVSPWAVQAGGAVTGGLMGWFAGSEAPNLLQFMGSAERANLKAKGIEGTQILSKLDSFNFDYSAAVRKMDDAYKNGDLPSYYNAWEQASTALNGVENTVLSSKTLFAKGDMPAKMAEDWVTRENELTQLETPLFDDSSKIYTTAIDNPEKVQTAIINGTAVPVPKDGIIRTTVTPKDVKLITWDGKAQTFQPKDDGNNAFKIDAAPVAEQPKPGEKTQAEKDIDNKAFQDNATQGTIEREKIKTLGTEERNKLFNSPDATGIVTLKNQVAGNTYLLDGQPIKMDGELSKVLTKGDHQVTIQNPQGYDIYVKFNVDKDTYQQVDLSAKPSDQAQLNYGIGYAKEQGYLDAKNNAAQPFLDNVFGGGGGSSSSDNWTPYVAPAATPMISFGTSLAGCKIFLDGVEISPMIGTNYATEMGYHTVKAVNSQGATAEKQVYVNADTPTTVNLQFEEVKPVVVAQAKIIFGATLAGKQVSLDGSAISPSIGTAYDVTQGYHVVSAINENGKTASKSVYCGTDQPTTVNLAESDYYGGDITPPTGSATITFGDTMKGCAISLDNKEIAPEINKAYDIKTGTHTVKATKANGQYAEGTLTITENNPVIVDFDPEDWKMPIPEPVSNVYDVSFTSTPEGAKILLGMKENNYVVAFSGEWTPSIIPLSRGLYKVNIYKLGYVQSEYWIWVDEVPLQGQAAQDKAFAEGYRTG